MKIVRVDHDGPRYGLLRGERIELLARDPFDGEPSFSGTSVPLAGARLLPPTQPTTVVAVGRNFGAHAAEVGLALGDVPSVFLKPLQTLVADDDEVILPEASERVEHEGELAVVISKQARNVRAEDAADVILGFTCANDVTARDLQRSDPQLTRGKGFDTFCPLGREIETDVSPFDRYEVICRVNGEERQHASTDEMIYPIADLIEFVTSWTTLMPGDVVLTGSPAGSGALQPGDSVEIEVPGVALLRHGVVGGPKD